MKNEYINIKEIAKAKGLKSTRSLRIEINKSESKYISREVKVNGGTSYEILFSSLEPELQQKLREYETKSTALVPLNYQSPIVTDKARQTANHRINIVKTALEHRKKYPTQNQADHEFLELYNTGLFLPKAYEFMGSISIGTLRRYIQAYKKNGNAECLIPQYQTTKQGEYNGILNEDMKKVLLALLLHQNKFGFNTAIRLTSPIYYYEMSGQLKTMLDRANALFSADYKFRDIYFLSSAADSDPHSADIAIQGIKGWIACFAKAQFKDAVLAAGAEAPGDVVGNSAMKEAYEMGQGV